jgi:hypothetical protein
MAEYFKEQREPEHVGATCLAEWLIIVGLFIIWITMLVSFLL